MPLWLTPLLTFLNPILDRVLPDKAKQDEVKTQLAMAAMQQEGALLDADLKIALAQSATNQAEASSGDKYAARWRPTIGYVIAAVVAYFYIINPLMMWVAAVWQPGLVTPKIPIDEHMWELVFGMLGLGGMRTFEKIKRAA